MILLELPEEWLMLMPIHAYGGGGPSYPFGSDRAPTHDGHMLCVKQLLIQQNMEDLRQ